uniref:serine hydrolase domain-containing protein n=1 Tax=Gelidibacter sp. TaxID=2018083 RepID=UPI004049C5F3|tara:strand:- start:55 stop:1473 length:1419 start_codon:yes stop_codon:yes gene_type:complete
MKKIKIALISIILFTSSIQAQNKEQLSQTEYAKDILTTEIKRMIEETGIPSISIALIKDENVIWAEAFGYVNIKTKTPATISTTYSTGSTVKPFMSMAIMQLVEKGIVDLDKPVNDYLENPIPSFSENSKPITLRHLLSHQSGLPASAEFVTLWGKDKRKTLQEIANEVKPVREPEEVFEYCNDGFVISALVIENQTGKSYGDYVKDNILKPLGLENINFTQPTPETVEEMALPYKLAYNNAFPEEQLFSEIYPAGGLTYLTPSQMSKFLIAHLNNGLFSGNRLLSSELMGLFHETSFGHEYYGLGIGIEKKNNYVYLFHSGLQLGYVATFKINLNSKTGVYLMANTIAEQHLNALAELATELMDGKRDFTPLPSFSTKEFKEIQITESESNKVIGTYKIEGTDFDLKILKRNNKLYLKNPADAEYEIIPYEKDKFFLKTEEEQIEFTNGENHIDGMVLYSSGNKIIAKRTK